MFSSVTITCGRSFTAEILYALRVLTLAGLPRHMMWLNHADCFAASQKGRARCPEVS